MRREYWELWVLLVIPPAAGVLAYYSAGWFWWILWLAWIIGSWIWYDERHLAAGCKFPDSFRDSARIFNLATERKKRRG